MTTLICLHGFTLNGAYMRRQMGELAAALSKHVELIYPDALYTCRPESIQRMQQLGFGGITPEPHLTWWDASEDGRVYGGWERTREQLRELLSRHQPAAVLGFSQGAILAASAAALASAGEFPEQRGAVLIAGRAPRALELQHLFGVPLRVPSLHVWGERDSNMAVHSAELVTRFAPAMREVNVWPGPHMIPTRGPAADAIVDFVRRRVQVP